MCGRTRDNPPFGWIALCAFVISALAITSLSTPWFQATITTKPANSTLTGVSTEFSFKLYNGGIRVENGGVSTMSKYKDLVLPSVEVVIGVARGFSIVVLVFAVIVWVASSFAHMKDFRLMLSEWAFFRTFYNAFLFYAIIITGFAVGSWIAIAGGLAPAMDDDDIIRQLTGGTDSCDNSYFDCTVLARRDSEAVGGFDVSDTHFPSSAFIVALFTSVISFVMLAVTLLNFRILQLQAPEQEPEPSRMA